MTRRCAVVAVMLALTGTGCGGGGGAADLDPATELDATGSAAVTDAAVHVDGHALVMTWADDATLAARNGPTVLLRFASASRRPALVSDPDCVPAFAGVLRDDAEALADASVTRQDDGTYLVRGVDLRVDVAVDDGRAGHLDGCGGPASLRVEAEQEERERAAAEEAAREAAEREAAEREAAEREAAEREAAAPEAAEREAAERDAPDSESAESGTAVPELPADAPVDDRVEVFPRDRTPSPAG